MTTRRIAKFSPDNKNISCTLLFKPDLLSTATAPTASITRANTKEIPNEKNNKITNVQAELPLGTEAKSTRRKKKIGYCKDDTEEKERLLKRQKRFGNVRDENEALPTTVEFNGASITSRNGKIEQRRYPKVVFSNDDSQFKALNAEEPAFVVEEKGYRSIPMDFFNRPGPRGWLCEAGTIVNYMIKNKMLKEPPWANNSSKPCEEPEIDFRQRIRRWK